jgi:SP family xylose:H+ symportor-like MFS transporter
LTDLEKCSELVGLRDDLSVELVLGLTYRAEIKGLPALVITLCTIGCYALSLAPVTWVLISEIFLNRLRGIGVSISMSAL